VGIAKSRTLTTSQCSDEQPLLSINDHTLATNASHMPTDTIANEQVVMAVPVNFMAETTYTDSASKRAKESIGRPRVRSRANMTEQQRREFLEADEWAAKVEPRSVICGACSMTILLNQRGGQHGQSGGYYPGPWMKHRRRCQEIKRLNALAMEVTSNPSGVHGLAS
jgi:hypothetical protein